MRFKFPPFNDIKYVPVGLTMYFGEDWIPK